MSLRNMHVDSNISDAALLACSEGILKKFISAFRQATANGAFKFGGIELKDPDLNRVHSIVNEIDKRRVFYACGEDESPKYAMQSLYGVRDEIRVLSRGLWTDRSCESLVQAISDSLADACSKAEKLKPDEISDWSPDSSMFMQVMTEMRLSVWVLVAVLQKKLGEVISPTHLPLSIKRKVENAEV